MTGWPFLVFTAAFAGIVYLHFLLAHREWRRSKGQQSSEVDPDYVRREDFLGQSFRQKVREWRQLPVRPAPDGSGHIIDRGRERIRLGGPSHYGPGSTVDEVLVVERDFSCDPGCTFSREIYVRRDAKVGARSLLQSIAVDGNLILGPEVTVVRWVDSGGDLEIGEGCKVRARAVSQGVIRLAPQAEAGSLFAPEVATSGRQDPVGASESPPVEPQELPLPPAVHDRSSHKWPLGCDPEKLVALSPDCWLYNGHLVLAAPLRLKSKLVVKGECSCPAGSILENDIKAKGSLRIGEDSVCKGNLVAGESIYLGARSRFEGVIHAGGTLRLCRGVRGLNDGKLVAAYSRDRLYVEDNVVVRGKLASGVCVIAVAPVSEDVHEKMAASGTLVLAQH